MTNTILTAHNEPSTLEDWEALLPPAPQPVGSYVPCVQVGNLVFTSGVLPMKDGAVAYTGAVGSISISQESGQEAAKLAALNALSVLKAQIGSLSNIRKIIKLTGFVNSVSSFTEQPIVINGASDLLVKVFGETIGKHARSAVGVSALPKNASVEIELIVEVSV
jgi:enamine deaminase RidA (YjgF/YER057c/UK114 family)